jgi:Zn-dependent peptidase ImmA (M78 family)
MSDDIKSIFSRRLRQARTMRAFSLRDLVSALNDAVSHNALAKYENGEMMPGSQVLGLLADALGQSPDFFFRPFTLHLKDVKFRKRVRLGIKDEESIRERAVEYFERYYEIEQLLGDERKFPGKLDISPAKTLEDAESAADRLREKWKLGRDPLASLSELLESKGIKVFEIDILTDAFDGFCADTEAGPVVVVSNKLNPLRKRMTVVHELAHIVLPVAKSVSDKDEEKLVARFAGAFLMPKEKFVAEIGKYRQGISLAELVELKLNFGASIWAIMMRARQLELITEAVFTRFCKVAASWRSDKKEPGDEKYLGNEGHSRFRQLIHRAVAEGQISASKGAGMLNESLGDLRKELREMFA